MPHSGSRSYPLWGNIKLRPDEPYTQNERGCIGQGTKPDLRVDRRHSGAALWPYAGHFWRMAGLQRRDILLSRCRAWHARNRLAGRPQAAAWPADLRRGCRTLACMGALGSWNGSVADPATPCRPDDRRSLRMVTLVVCAQVFPCTNNRHGPYGIPDCRRNCRNRRPDLPCHARSGRPRR